jgi:hypothetical protein
MDYTGFLTTLDLSAMGFVGVATFGTVAAANLFYKSRTGKELASETKLIASVVTAIVFGFVPADLGSIILNKVRDGVSVALLLHGFYQGLGKIMQAAAGTKTMSS